MWATSGHSRPDSTHALLSLVLARAAADLLRANMLGDARLGLEPGTAVGNRGVGEEGRATVSGFFAKGLPATGLVAFLLPLACAAGGEEGGTIGSADSGEESKTVEAV